VLAAIREEVKRSEPFEDSALRWPFTWRPRPGCWRSLSARPGLPCDWLRASLSTDDSVATALAEVHGLDVYARKWQSNEEYYENLNKVWTQADLVIDDGSTWCLLHTKRVELLKGVRGGNEETRRASSGSVR